MVLSLTRKASSLSKRLKPEKQGKTTNQPLTSKPHCAGVVNPVVRQAVNQGLLRRDFLKLSALAASGGLAGIVFASYLEPAEFVGALLNQPKQINPMAMVNAVDPSANILDPLSIPKFENQLTTPPPVYQPTVITSQGTVIRHEYTVAMASFEEQILPPSMNLRTSVWGYGGTATDALTKEPLGFVQSSPGPTFETIRGIPIKVKWQNNITSPYMFPVDPTIHWANPKNNPMPTSSFPTYPPGFTSFQSPVPLVTHLHGGENQSYSDGGPEQWFTADGTHGSAYSTVENTDSNTAVYYYPNEQQPTTLWYHDHALGLTRLNVQTGLAGFYIIREPKAENDKVAPTLPTGKYEMPLVIQDRTFNTDGSLYYPTIGSDPANHPYWVNSFQGNAIIVNGKAWPNMNVEKAQYRFRLLNGSNSRFININLSNSMSFIQIGSDGGYLKAPVTLTSLALAPAERADLIVDFSNVPSGTKIIIQNTSLLTNSDQEKQTVGQIMQFTVIALQGPAPFKIASAPQPFNPTLSATTFPTLLNPSKQRILTLFEIMGGQNNATSEALLDGQNWEGAISETPQLGATEDWIIVNTTLDAHPIHLHLVQFQLVSRQPFNVTGYLDEWIKLNGQPPFNHPTHNVVSLSSYLTGTATSAQPEEQGWKDTLTVYSGEVVTLRVRFAPQDGSSFTFDAAKGPGYVWHCHLLEHEDHQMMRPYKIQAPAANVPLETTVVVTAVGAATAAAILIAYKQKRKNKQTPEKSVEQGNVPGVNALP